MNSNLPTEVTSDPSENDFFANYHKNSHSVSPGTNDAVTAYFLGMTKGNSNAATALASTLFEISKEYDVDPMTILDDFKSFRGGKESFKKALIALFNKTRRNTSKIGFEQTQVMPPSVARNIRK